MKKYLILLALIAVHTTAWAVQAWRSPIQVSQPNGATLTILLQGDEHHHLQTTTDGFALATDAQGYLRYATLMADGSWNIEGAPIAHNLQQRSTEEQAYLATLKKVDLREVIDLQRQHMTEQSALRAHLSTSHEQAQSPKRAAVQAISVDQMRTGNFPVKDSIKAVVLLAQFSDKEFTYDYDYYERMMNEPGFCDDGEIGSVRDYYLTQSGGQFRPHFDVFGPIQLLHSARYYGANDIHGSDQNSQYLIKEAAELAADKYGCDFSQYDNDGDGDVDMVYVIFPGYGEHAGGGDDCIWPHKYQLSSYDFEVIRNGVRVNVYACSAELWMNTGTQSSSIGVFCHEFSHVLGLADHYNTTNSSIYNFGYHDVMDYGNYNDEGRRPVSFSAFERACMGWMDLEELNIPQKGIIMEDLKKGGKAYRLSTQNPNEFFVLENRQKSGFDQYMPDEGMMISHVDFLQSAWNQNIVNDDPSHCRYILCPADGDLSYNNAAKDLFPSSSHNSFTDETTPSSLAWDGSATDRWVTNIRINRTSDLISFDFMDNHLLAPTAYSGKEIMQNGFTAYWSPVEGASSYNLHLLKYSLIADAKIALEENFDKMTDGSFQSPDPNDIAADLDSYTQKEGWQGEQVYQAGGMAKLGTVGVSGWIETPELDFSHYDGLYTLILEVRAFTGKTPVFSITSGDNTAKHRLNDKEKVYKYLFQGGTEATRLRFEIQKERAYINSITIVRGDATEEYPDAQPVSVTYQPASAPRRADAEEPVIDLTGYQADEVQLLSGLSDINYTFSDLEPNTIYGYYLEAVATGKISYPSNTVIVDLAQGLGIEQVHPDIFSSSSCFDLLGRRLTSPNGCYIQGGKLQIVK